MIKKEEIIKQYLKYLEIACYETIMSLFTDEAIVQSPLYGLIPAKVFYRDLLNDTSSSKITLKDIFLSTMNENTSCACFEYIWTLKDGKKVTFEVVDIFEFDKTNKIKQLTIIYDTYPIRPSISMRR